jgi:hypothetical protein
MAEFDDSLLKKLGVRPGLSCLVINDPIGLTERLDSDASAASPQTVNVAVVFVRSIEELNAVLDSTLTQMAINGGIWISWPKKASKIPCNVNENLLRDLLLPTGLVDNKICSVNEIWTAVRFVWRLEVRARLIQK